MIIGIDGNEANIKERVGSNVFAYKVLWGIYEITQRKKIKNQNEHINFNVYLKNDPLSDLPKPELRWHYNILKPDYGWTQWRLPLGLYLSNNKPAIFFTPGHYSPRFCPCPTIISIMDLAFLRFPEQFKTNDLYQLVNWTKYSVKKAKHIFTISEFTKREIIHFYDYPCNQITVIYPAVWTKNKEEKSLLGDRERNYLLYIGTLQPRKNLIRLIRAFRETVIEIKKESLKLIIAGKKGWMYEEIFNEVKKLNLQDKIIFKGYVSEEEKRSLYKNALAFVYPSLYEGFGIPVLEAKITGCPVITSKISSLTEVGGKAVIYIEDVYSVDSIKKSILKMLKLTHRERSHLIALANRESKKFDWDLCTQKIIKVLWFLLKIKTENN